MPQADPMADNQPDLTITEADLIEADQHSHLIARFVPDSTPKPLAPTALVEARCASTNRAYLLLFEQTSPSSWALVSALDPSTSPAYPGSIPQSAVRKDLVSGAIEWSNLTSGQAACPHCSTQFVFKCGKCSRLNCHPDGQQGSWSRCAYCGNTGKLQGTIKSLDASQGKGTK